MGFSDIDVEAFRSFVANARRPVVLYDDDPDGVTSYAMLARALERAGAVNITGIVVKKTPEVNEGFIKKTLSAHPDIIFILDKPKVADKFLEKMNVPVIWLDHHLPSAQDRDYELLTYFNPRVADDADNKPTCHWVYFFVGEPDDLWVALLGVVADWHIPDFIAEAKKRYGFLLPKKWSRVEDLYLDNPLATLIRVVNFNLKGDVRETLRGIEAFRKVREPQEILEQTSEAGSFLWGQYKKYADEYDALLARARTTAEENKEDALLLFIYETKNNSFTSELSNELLIRYPHKIVVVGRHDRGEVKASLRSGPGSPDVDQALKVAVKDLRGYGGGHKKACGACIHEDDWPVFLERFRELL